MNTDNKLTISEIQRFCMHDGPGIRTTVFLKGCHLRCAWCHNPETQKPRQEILFYSKKCIGCRSCERVCSDNAHVFGEQHMLDREKCVACGDCVIQCPTDALALCGKPYTVEELLSIIERDRAFYGNDGGVTLSGGEPLLQGKTAVDLLKACQARGISTAVETCGYVDADTVLSAIPHTNLFLWDLKDTNDTRHRQYTGASNKKILDNLAAADACSARIRLRCILVNGVNTDEAHYREIAEIAASLSNCEGVEFIPYHADSGTKAVFIGKKDNGRSDWIPQAEQLEKAKRILKDRSIPVF